MNCLQTTPPAEQETPPKAEKKTSEDRSEELAPAQETPLVPPPKKPWNPEKTAQLNTIQETLKTLSSNPVSSDQNPEVDPYKTTANAIQGLCEVLMAGEKVQTTVLKQSAKAIQEKLDDHTGGLARDKIFNQFDPKDLKKGITLDLFRTSLREILKLGQGKTIDKDKVEKAKQACSEVFTLKE